MKPTIQHDLLNLLHRLVHSDQEVLQGTLVFRETRVTAQTLIDYLDDGMGLDGFLQEFPTVDRDDAEAFLMLARES